MKRPHASALLVVLTVLTGLTILLTSWWQTAGWACDLAIVRQRAIANFYATEIVRAYGVAWTKKEFNGICSFLARFPKQPLHLAGGSFQLVDGVGEGAIIIDRVPGDRDQVPHVVRLTAIMNLNQKGVACHRCIIQDKTNQETKERRFVVSHCAFGVGR